MLCIMTQHTIKSLTYHRLDSLHDQVDQSLKERHGDVAEDGSVLGEVEVTQAVTSLELGAVVHVLLNTCEVNKETRALRRKEMMRREEHNTVSQKRDSD